MFLFQWSVFQIQTNLIKASGGIQSHDTWRKEAESTQARTAPRWGTGQDPCYRSNSPRMDCFGRPGRPSSAATPPGLGAAPAVLLMTTRGQARLCISLLGSRTGLPGRPQDARSFAGRPGATPAPQPRGPAAAPAHGGHGCCLLGDVATPSGKRMAQERQHPGRERQRPDHTRQMLADSSSLELPNPAVLLPCAPGHRPHGWSLTSTGALCGCRHTSFSPYLRFTS